MTPDDLAAIEVRHRSYCAEKLLPPEDDICVDCGTPWRCDARRLLDELLDELRRLQDTVDFQAKAYLEEHGNWGVCSWRVKYEAERARIAEAVKELGAWLDPDKWPAADETEQLFVRRAAVLEAIGGEK
jgi:hypothetical protein